MFPASFGLISFSSCKTRSRRIAAALDLNWLASAYALKGDLDRAAAELAEARKLRGDPRPWSIAGLRVRCQDPTIRALAEATLVTGLRKAGIPEE